MSDERERRESARYSLTTRVSSEVYREFDVVCRRLGLAKHGKVNVALEGLIAYFVEQFRDQPAIVQQTLTNVFVKAEPQSQVTVNVAQKLVVKMIRRDLSYILEKIEDYSNNPRTANQSDYWVRILSEKLPKAVAVYEKTFDPELEKLLKKAEKWV